MINKLVVVYPDFRRVYVNFGPRDIHACSTGIQFREPESGRLLSRWKVFPASRDDFVCYPVLNNVVHIDVL